MNAVVEFAHGLVLLFGIGTGALPSWDTKKRRNNLLGGLAVSAMAGPSGHTNSPHPSSREGHHSTRWSSSFLLSGDPEWFSCCCRGLLSCPTELEIGRASCRSIHVVVDVAQRVLLPVWLGM